MTGLALTLIKIQADRERSDVNVQTEFRTRKVSAAEEFPHLNNFPLPIARLMVEQIHAAEERLSNGKTPPVFINPECHCGFFRKYHLPCKHLFHHQIAFGGGDEGEEGSGDAGILTEEAWEGFELMFAEGGGYDVWSVSSRVFVDEEGPSEEQLEADARKREFTESLEMLRDFYFRAEEYARNTLATAPATKKRRNEEGTASQPATPDPAAFTAAVKAFAGKWQFHGATFGSQAGK